MQPGPTARGVFARAVATLRIRWRPILVVALVVFLPIGLLDVLDQAFSELDTDELGTADALGVVAIGLSLAMSELFAEIMLAGVIAAAIGAAHGERESRSLGEVLRGIPYARLIAITLISVAAFGLGLVLFVLPAIYLLGRFGLAAPVAEVEGLGVREAFARSLGLTRGHIMLVLGVLVPLGLLSSAAGEAAQSAGVDLLGDALAGEWIGAVVAGVLISTPWALAAVALVYELRSAEAGAARPAGSRSSRPRPR